MLSFPCKCFGHNFGSYDWIFWNRHLFGGMQRLAAKVEAADVSTVGEDFSEIDFFNCHAIIRQQSGAGAIGTGFRWCTAENAYWVITVGGCGFLDLIEPSVLHV